jgi:hypothetical protein
MKGSVRKGGVRESARNRLFARLHSHFMAELKPAHERQPGIGWPAVEKGEMATEPPRRLRFQPPPSRSPTCRFIVHRNTGMPVSRQNFS